MMPSCAVCLCKPSKPSSSESAIQPAPTPPVRLTCLACGVVILGGPEGAERHAFAAHLNPNSAFCPPCGRLEPPVSAHFVREHVHRSCTLCLLPLSQEEDPATHARDCQRRGVRDDLNHRDHAKSRQPSVSRPWGPPCSTTTSSSCLPCPACDYTSPSRSNVTRHFEAFHISFYCRHCPWKGVGRKAIAEHVRRQHPQHQDDRYDASDAVDCGDRIMLASIRTFPRRSKPPEPGPGCMDSDSVGGASSSVLPMHPNVLPWRRQSQLAYPDQHEEILASLTLPVVSAEDTGEVMIVGEKTGVGGWRSTNLRQRRKRNNRRMKHVPKGEGEMATSCLQEGVAKSSLVAQGSDTDSVPEAVVGVSAPDLDPDALAAALTADRRRGQEERAAIVGELFRAHGFDPSSSGNKHPPIFSRLGTGPAVVVEPARGDERWCNLNFYQELETASF